MDKTETFSRWSPYLLAVFGLYAISTFLSDHPHVFLNGVLFGVMLTLSLLWVLFGRNPRIKREVLQVFELQQVAKDETD